MRVEEASKAGRDAAIFWRKVLLGGTRSCE
jgi:hypothetical protein